MMTMAETTSSSATAETLFTRMTSPVGELLLVGERRGRGVALRGVYFAKAAHAEGVLPRDAREDAGPFAKVIEQLGAYFAGERTSFDLPLAPHGTDFQQKVWRALAAIPYGETTTYAAIAKKIGKPRAVRAVGAANGRNPLSIVVPCHRVIGNDGTLTGYAGGLPNKKRLLELESPASASARSR
jgi:methylated-DNA-[protein]-cysteine S-methyltransferase